MPATQIQQTFFRHAISYIPYPAQCLLMPMPRAITFGWAECHVDVTSIPGCQENDSARFHRLCDASPETRAYITRCD